MQSKTTRGVRRLLVSTGVISLVLSVAAPAALADKPVDHPGGGSEHSRNDETGAERVRLCHNGRVIEVDDDGHLGGHSNHEGDFPVTDGTPVGGTCSRDGGTASVLVCREGVVVALPQGEELTADDEIVDGPDVVVGAACPADGDSDGVLVCHEGQVTEVDQDAELADHQEHGDEVVTDLGAAVGDDCAADDDVTTVRICHNGQVIEVDDDATLGGHAGHGDQPAAEGAVVGDTCGDVIIGKPEVKEPVEVIETPEETEPVVEVKPDPPVTPAEPALPLPEQAGPKPVVIISTDTVTKPAPAVTPAVPARQPEVLGSVTTRIPGSTTANVTALAATGTSTTTVLAALGSVLLLAGLGLQLVGRRQAAAALGA